MNVHGTRHRLQIDTWGLVGFPHWVFPSTLRDLAKQSYWLPEYLNWRLLVSHDIAPRLIRVGHLTKRGMLKRESNYVFYPLDGVGQGISWKSFADDDLDPANIVAWVPVIMV